MKTLASLAFAAALSAVALAPPTASAQAYPSKAIRLICPYASGGATDIISRAVAVELSKTLGQTVNVDNRPGAGANLGSEMTARSAPDGYTLLTSASSLHGNAPFLYKKLSYVPNKDLAPVIVLAGYESTAWFGIAVPAGTPKDINARLNADGQKATRSPEFVKRMTDLGYEIVGGTPEQMASMIQDEYRRWGPIVNASGAKVD